MPVRPDVDPLTLARARTEEAARRRRVLRLGEAVLQEAIDSRAGVAGAGRAPLFQQAASNGLNALCELRRARTAGAGSFAESCRAAAVVSLQAVAASAVTLLRDQAAGLTLHEAEYLAAAVIAGEPGLTPHEQLAAGVAVALADEWRKLMEAATLQQRAIASSS